MKRFILPPLAPLALIWMVGLYEFAVIKFEPPVFHNGQPDNGPYHAKMLLPFISPLIYSLFFAINGIDALFEKVTGTLHWISSGAIIAIFATISFLLLYNPALDLSAPIYKIASGDLFLPSLF